MNINDKKPCVCQQTSPNPSFNNTQGHTYGHTTQENCNKKVFSDGKKSSQLRKSCPSLEFICVLVYIISETIQRKAVAQLNLIIFILKQKFTTFHMLSLYQTQCYVSSYFEGKLDQANDECI